MLKLFSVCFNLHGNTWITLQMTRTLTLDAAADQTVLFWAYLSKSSVLYTIVQMKSEKDSASASAPASISVNVCALASRILGNRLHEAKAVDTPFLRFFSIFFLGPSQILGLHRPKPVDTVILSATGLVLYWT